jgi:integrase
MSVHSDRGSWIVRWRDGSGRQRGKRFASEELARAFDAGVQEVGARERRPLPAFGGAGVYPYATKAIGPRLTRVLHELLARRGEMAASEQDRAYLFVMPERVAKRDHGRWESVGAGEPMDRTTVSRDWHKQTLQDAALRDMPLHALRHTAAAAWLAAGNSLMHVQRQLGHAEISTTEHYYGHLERHVLAAGAVATEEAIASARRGS